jgi:hypothetical protein
MVKIVLLTSDSGHQCDFENQFLAPSSGIQKGQGIGLVLAKYVPNTKVEFRFTCG